MSVVDDIVAGREQMKNATLGLETPSMGAWMTHDEWIAAGRPHWRCEVCRGIYVTVMQPHDFICWLCKESETEKIIAAWRCHDCNSELLESGWCNHCSPKRIEIMKLETPKPAKFTAEELRKIEDAVKKDIDGQDELRQAVAYAYLNGLGWRMTRAQHVIDKALK